MGRCFCIANAVITRSAGSLFSCHSNSIESNHSLTPISIISTLLILLNSKNNVLGETAISSLPSFTLQAISAKEIDNKYPPELIFLIVLFEKVGDVLHASISAQVSKTTIHRIQVKHAH